MSSHIHQNRWMWRALEFIAGFLLAAATLRDVFYTVIVPGSTRGLFKVSRRLVHMALPFGKRMHRRGIDVNFAPMVLVGSFVVWMTFLVLGFGLMTHAMPDRYDPPLTGFGQALYIAGGMLTTAGPGLSDVLGVAQLVLVVASFCGLGVMTLAVTYLLEVQSNVAHRDTGVLKITTAAGRPPCALALVERYAELGCTDELVDALREGRHWCATVLQSHASHPWLVYFRSVGTGSGWPASLGTLMDLALMAEFVIDDPRLRGAAVLAREQADRLAHDLAVLVNAQAAPVGTRREEAEAMMARLAAAGFRLRADRDVDRFVAARDEHVASINALAHHLGTAGSPLLPLSTARP